MLKSEKIICFSLNHWYGLPTSKQHIVRILTAKNDVIYIEPPTDIFSVLLRRARWYKLPQISQVNNRLKLISPIVLWSVRGHKPTIPILHWYIRFLLWLAQIVTGSKPSLLWFFDHLQYSFVTTFPQAKVIYQIVDNYLTSPSRSKREYRLQAHNKLCHKSDAVFTTTKKFYDTAININPNTYIIPNGVNLSHYYQRLGISIKLPDKEKLVRLKERKKLALAKRSLSEKDIRIGFVGGIRDYQYKMVKELAYIRPQYRIYLVGPIPSHDLDKLDNISCLGRINYDDLPELILTLDVGFFPFPGTPRIRDSNPIIFYEFLCLGKPVVSTPINYIPPEFKTVRWANTSEEFASEIDTALRENTDELKIKRIQAVADATWYKRVELMSSIIEKGK